MKLKCVKTRLISILLVLPLGAVVSFQSVRRTEITILNFCVYFFTRPHTICVRLFLFKEYKRERERILGSSMFCSVRERELSSVFKIQHSTRRCHIATIIKLSNKFFWNSYFMCAYVEIHHTAKYNSEDIYWSFLKLQIE